MRIWQHFGSPLPAVERSEDYVTLPAEEAAYIEMLRGERDYESYLAVRSGSDRVIPRLTPYEESVVAYLRNEITHEELCEVPR